MQTAETEGDAAGNLDSEQPASRNELTGSSLRSAQKHHEAAVHSTPPAATARTHDDKESKRDDADQGKQPSKGECDPHKVPRRDILDES